MEHLADYGVARNHPTSRNAERIPSTYVLSCANDPVNGCSVKLCGFVVAEWSGAETEFPVCRVEPLLVSSGVLLRNDDGHDGILFDEGVEQFLIRPFLNARDAVVSGNSLQPFPVLEWGNADRSPSCPIRCVSPPGTSND